MTRNGERLENHVLCHATIFGIEQFPSERIYISSTQKCSYSIFLKENPLGTFIPGRLGTSLAVCRDKIFAGKIVNMAVLREVS